MEKAQNQPSKDATLVNIYLKSDWSLMKLTIDICLMRKIANASLVIFLLKILFLQHFVF